MRSAVEPVEPEEQLRRLGRELVAILEGSPDLVARLDRDLRYVYLNPAAARAIGRERGAIVGKTHAELFGTEGPRAARFVDGVRRAIDSGEEERFSFELLGEAGVSYYEARLLPEPYEGDGRTVLFVAREVTARHTDAEAARRTLERFRALFEQSPLGVFLFNAALRVTHANAACALLARGGGAPIVGRDLADDARLAPVLRAALDGEARAYEGAYDGGGAAGERWIALRVAPLRDGGGAVTGGMAIVEDVTDRKQLEEQLRQAQKMEAVGRLAGGVAHDFNNLLTAIRTNGELVLDALPPDSPIRDDVVEIRAATDRAAALTRKLLAFSRKQAMTLEVLDPNAVVTDMERMLRRVLGEDVAVDVRLEEAGTARADRGQLEQVLLNLVVNARDAMPNGGTIRIETYPLDRSDIGPAIAIAVRDEGCGMDERTRARVFEPFFTTKEIGKGTGLGLSTAHGIVTQLGGRIAVESAPGEGSTFTVLLPRTGEPPSARRRSLHTGARLGSETVLVVEDEPAVRRGLRRVLEQQGYTVLEAANGRDALDVCEATPRGIDLVLTDVVMPHMGGRQLVDRLRERFPRIRTLFMSGHDDDAVATHGVPSSHGLLLEKPFSSAALVERVREVLDGVAAAI